MQTQNSLQQPINYNEFPKNEQDKNQDATRFDRLRSAPLNDNEKESNPANGYKNDPSPMMPPPHHNLESANAAHGNNFKSSPNKEAPLKRDSGVNLAQSGQSGSGSGLVKQDSAATIGGMKTDAYLHNISVDGSGVITNMNYNRHSPNSTLNRHSPNSVHDPSKPIILERNDNSNRTHRPSQFEYLKPHHQHNDDDLGVRMDGDTNRSESPKKMAPVVGHGKSHEWTFDPSKQADSEKAPPMGTKVEIKEDNIEDIAPEEPKEEPRAKLEADTSEKLGGAQHEGNTHTNFSTAAAIVGSQSAIAGAPTATAVAPTNNRHMEQPANDSSLLNANKSGSFNSPGGTHHTAHKHEKTTMWQKITCRGGSKTKPGKHYVNPSNVVINNQGLK